MAISIHHHSMPNNLNHAIMPTNLIGLEYNPYHLKNPPPFPVPHPLLGGMGKAQPKLQVLLLGEMAQVAKVAHAKNQKKDAPKDTKKDDKEEG